MLTTGPRRHKNDSPDIRLFTRKPLRGYYSIEKLFSAISRALPPDLSVRILRCPVISKGLGRLIICLLYAWIRRGRINHIVGDVHYLALAFPSRSLILTVHDLNRLYQLRGVRKRVYKWLYFDLPIRRAARVVAISPSTGTQLGALFPIGLSKLVIIPDCLPSGFAAAPKSFNSYRPVILQIGTASNKNIERMIEAARDINCELWIVGRLSPAQRELLENSHRPFRNTADISEPELIKLYQDCDIVVYVSTAEGFGLPILEAQAVGRPVITADLEPMRGVAAGGACLVDPYDVQSIRAGMRLVINNPDFRTRIVQRGFENVQSYSPALVGMRYADLYRSVLKGALRTVVDPETTPAPASTP